MKNNKTWRFVLIITLPLLFLYSNRFSEKSVTFAVIFYKLR
mgnify:FL=1